MFDSDNQVRSHFIMESTLEKMSGTLTAVLNGKCQLTTNPALGDPPHGVWDIESNLLRFLLCQTLEALGKEIPPEDACEGVKYYVEETDRIL